MRTRGRASIRGWLVGGALVAVASSPAPLTAQTTAEQPRVAVLVTLGAMRPLEAGVRALYRGAFVPVTVEGDFFVRRPFFVFGSARFVAKDGEVVFDMPPAPVERFPLRVSLRSIRVGGGVAFERQRWLFSAGAGLSYTSFKEEWPAVEGPAVTGRTVGVVAHGGVDCRVVKRLWAVGRVEYSYTPVDGTREVLPSFDLSGVSVSGGVAVRF